MGQLLIQSHNFELEKGLKEIYSFPHIVDEKQGSRETESWLCSWHAALPSSSASAPRPQATEKCWAGAQLGGAPAHFPLLFQITTKKGKTKNSEFILWILSASTEKYVWTWPLAQSYQTTDKV